MIDHLRLHLFFKMPLKGTSINNYIHSSYDGSFGWCSPEKMGVPVSVDYDITEEYNENYGEKYENNLEIKNIRSQYLSLSSGWSGMAFKIHSNSSMRNETFPFIEVKASPAKMEQAHNLSGTDDLEHCVNVMLQTLFFRFPHLEDLIDLRRSEIRHIDINYSVKLENHDLAKRCIAYLSNISGGQSRGASTYPTSHYWGGKTHTKEGEDSSNNPSQLRHKINKVYLKYEEMQFRVGEFLKSGHTNIVKQNFFLINAALHHTTLGVLRFETRLKDRFLQSAGIRLNIFDFIQQQQKEPDIMQRLFNKSFNDIFKTLKGHKMKFITDNKVFKQLKIQFDTVKKNGNISTTKSENYYKTYKLIKSEGYDYVKDHTNRYTLRNHINAFAEINISKAYLQNLGKKTDSKDQSAEVIPFVKFVEIKFEEQAVHPSELPPLIYDFMSHIKPRLKLVA